MSLHADTDALEILADDSVTVTSVNGAIAVTADKKIVLHAGQASITLEDINITLTGSHKISVKGGLHRFKGGASNTVELAGLPDTRVKLFDEAFVLKDKKTGKPIIGMPYRIKLPDGTFEEGISDEQGHTHLVRGVSADQLDLQIKG